MPRCVGKHANNLAELRALFFELREPLASTGICIVPVLSEICITTTIMMMMIIVII